MIFLVEVAHADDQLQEGHEWFRGVLEQQRGHNCVNDLPCDATFSRADTLLEVGGARTWVSEYKDHLARLCEVFLSDGLQLWKDKVLDEHEGSVHHAQQ